MKLQISLNPELSAVWSGIIRKPEFVGMNMAGVLNTLMYRYLNPQNAFRSVPSKPTEPDKPVIGKVELRQQAEREAREEADLAPFRLSGVWPKPRVSMDPEIEFWDFPDGRLESWTPPDDYPGDPHPGNLPDDDGASTGRWLREMEKLKAAGVVKDKVELP